MAKALDTQQGETLPVLIAEENARLRRIVCLNLEREGLRTLEASSLLECQARLVESEVGLIMVSSELPGFEIASFSRRLRERFPDRPIPVFILSFEPEDRLLTIPLRAGFFQQKPFDPGMLADQVTRLMQTA